MAGTINLAQSQTHPHAGHQFKLFFHWPNAEPPELEGAVSPAITEGVRDRRWTGGVVDRAIVLVSTSDRIYRSDRSGHCNLYSQRSEDVVSSPARALRFVVFRDSSGTRVSESRAASVSNGTVCT